MPYRRYRRNYTRRSVRPTNRIIRAASDEVPVSSQSEAYVYTAEDPQKVTNFRLDIFTTSGVTVPYALVMIPEGYNANTMTYPATSDDLYNPTNMVLISGVLIDNTQDHKWSRYSRKLNPGDRIALLLLNSSASVAADVSFQLSFTAVH